MRKNNVSVFKVATALGLEVKGNVCKCFNTSAHSNNSDNNPSMKLYGDTNRFFCFACNIWGDAIDLVKLVKGVGFRDALNWIESAFGKTTLDLNEPSQPYVPRKTVPDAESLHIYDWLKDNCFEIDSGSSAGKYLLKRGIDLRVAMDHGAGEVEDPIDVWTRLTKDFSLKAIKKAGLISSKGNFLFSRHRLLFFYLDDGLPFYIQGRDTSGESRAKELSLTELVSPAPFNIDAVKDTSKTVFVVEGCINTLSLLTLGVNAVGVPGAGSFREDWFQYFKTLKSVTVIADNDTPGIRHAKQLSMDFRRRGIKSEWKLPTIGNDANDFLVNFKTGEKI